jgi:hypothetical protein
MSSIFSGRGSPNRLLTKIPRVIKIYVSEPRAPFNSLGESSFIKLGTKTEKAPVANPNKNFPISITGRFLKQLRVHPTIKIKLVACIAFSLPHFSAGIPAIIEATAEPKAQIDVITPFQRLVSPSVFHPKRY